MIIDFDLINNNLHSVFGSIKIPKEMKDEVKEESFLKEFRLKEENIKKLIVRVNRNIDLISSTNLIFDKNYIVNKEKIKEMLEKLKKNYDYIFIDTTNDSKYFELMQVLNLLSSKVICLIEGNLISIKKSMNLIKEVKEQNKKIEIIYNKNSKYTMNEKIVKMVFFKYKVIGSLSYNNRYDHIINKNVNKLYISTKIKKEFEEIKQKLQIK